ncbi:hypothetical protein GGC64_006261 [Mycobacterium sp. OAS707]|uniref:hemerythrin domain-containing protein n=1 Tax=Mycobacterium sp. OAS707 TaxID=2663822 RepID=UPI00178ADDE6|nr:hemerythrin domain-containing protein [Mycobacterium sp. OAS707]MBE1552174.1 hypothetical protein [Mycobacterium sp. OAS707]
MDDPAIDVLALFRADHSELFTLMAYLQHAVDHRLFHQVDSVRGDVLALYAAHEAVEQQWFWPAVRMGVDGGAALAEQAIGEEESTKGLLYRLRAEHPTEPTYGEAVGDFVGAVRAHLVFEEAAVWPRFSSDVRPAQRASLSRYVAQMRPSAPRTPHPRAPSGSTEKPVVRDVLARPGPCRPTAQYPWRR